MALPLWFGGPPDTADFSGGSSPGDAELYRPRARESLEAIAGHSDDETISRIRAGDDDAYGALFLALHDNLCEFATTYVGSVAVAEELVQDIFLDLWVRRDVWDPPAGIRAYLFRSVRNRAINAARNQRTARRLSAGDPEAWVGDAPSIPNAGDDAAALAAAIASVLAALPSARRRAAVMRWRFGLSYAEIAETLGTSVASVTMHIARAREAVRPVVEAYSKE